MISLNQIHLSSPHIKLKDLPPSENIMRPPSDKNLIRPSIDQIEFAEVVEVPGLLLVVQLQSLRNLFSGHRPLLLNRQVSQDQLLSSHQTSTVGAVGR
jgi:hypothetical protein